MMAKLHDLINWIPGLNIDHDHQVHSLIRPTTNQSPKYNRVRQETKVISTLVFQTKIIEKTKIWLNAFIYLY